MDTDTAGFLFEDPHAQQLAEQMATEQPDMQPLLESMSRHPSVLLQPDVAIKGLLRIREIYSK